MVVVGLLKVSQVVVPPLCSRGGLPPSSSTGGSGAIRAVAVVSPGGFTTINGTYGKISFNQELCEDITEIFFLARP